MSRQNENAGFNATGVIYGVSFGGNEATVWTVSLREPFETEEFEGRELTFFHKLIHAVDAISAAVVQGVDSEYREFIAKGKVDPAIKRAVKDGNGDAVSVSLSLSDYKGKVAPVTDEALKTAAAE